MRRGCWSAEGRDGDGCASEVRVYGAGLQLVLCVAFAERALVGVRVTFLKRVARRGCSPGRPRIAPSWVDGGGPVVVMGTVVRHSRRRKWATVRSHGESWAVIVGVYRVTGAIIEGPCILFRITLVQRAFAVVHVTLARRPSRRRCNCRDGRVGGGSALVMMGSGVEPSWGRGINDVGAYRTARTIVVRIGVGCPVSFRVTLAERLSRRERDWGNGGAGSGAKVLVSRGPESP